MTLTLAITNRNRLENGSPLELVLHARGAVIGRAQTCEWSLPDEARVLSGRHCEVQFRDGSYTLVDLSTNGTYFGNEAERMAEPRRIRHGDRFRVGPFELEARLSGDARAQHDAEVASSARASQGPAWSDWDDFPGGGQPPPPPAHDPFARTGGGGWDLPGEAREDVSAWADRAGGGGLAPSANKIFNSLTENHKVDWTNAAWDVAPGFDPFAIPGESSAATRPSTSDPLPGTSRPAADSFGGALNEREQPAASSDPFGALDPAYAPAPPPPPPPPPPPQERPAAFSPPPATNEGWSPHAGVPIAPASTRASPLSPPPQAQAAPAPVPASAPSVPADAAYRELITALGIPSAALTEAPDAAAARAGRMLRRLLAGLMILLEARARAKDEMGASATQLRFEGNNPLKFARNVEQALQMMMNPAMQGYMEAESAIEDSYRDLQAHQIATLRAMQGALRATLQRFSPASIKARVGDEGMLSKLVPGKREAALWRAYEKQFSGVAEGSAEAFLEIFSKEFRQAYEDAARGN